jgi:hypothetical protein
MSLADERIDQAFVKGGVTIPTRGRSTAISGRTIRRWS